MKEIISVLSAIAQGIIAAFAAAIMLPMLAVVPFVKPDEPFLLARCGGVTVSLAAA